MLSTLDGVGHGFRFWEFGRFFDIGTNLVPDIEVAVGRQEMARAARRGLEWLDLSHSGRALTYVAGCIVSWRMGAPGSR